MAVQAYFGKERRVDNGRLSVAVGSGEEQFLPYDFLYAGLASCFYYTLISLAEKMQLSWEFVEIEVDGKKRAEKIATLEWVKMDIKVKGLEGEQEKFLRASDLAGKYCSIHETISQVADIEQEVTFL